MLIRGKGRLRDISRYLRRLDDGATVVVGLSNADQFAPELERAGFDPLLVLGERILPTAIGPVTRANAEGVLVVHKDEAKETAYRQVEWTREQWRGRYTEQVTDVVDIPYMRYPRTLVPPIGTELAIAASRVGDRVVITDPIDVTAENEVEILRRVNLLGELFGAAELLTSDLEQFTRVKYRRLNWEVLPAGEAPWPRVRQAAEIVLAARAPGSAVPVLRRLELLTKEHEPDLVAVGRAGFAGYFVFGFQQRGIHVLESLEYGNATYVLGDDWAELSQLTKAEILREDLHLARVVHRQGWERRIQDALHKK